MGMTEVDEMIEDFERDRRHRVVLVVAAVIGIVAGALLGVGIALGGFVTGPRNPAILAFFMAPFLASMALGYAVYGVLRWRAASSGRAGGLPAARVASRRAPASRGWHVQTTGERASRFP